MASSSSSCFVPRFPPISDECGLPVLEGHQYRFLSARIGVFNGIYGSPTERHLTSLEQIYRDVESVPMQGGGGDMDTLLECAYCNLSWHHRCCVNPKGTPQGLCCQDARGCVGPSPPSPCRGCVISQGTPQGMCCLGA